MSGKEKVRFRGSVTYDAASVRKMERIRFRTFNLVNSMARILCAGIMVVCGYLTGGTAGTIFVAFGCILAVSGDIVGRWRCDQTVKALGGKSLAVSYQFYEDRFDTRSGGAVQTCDYKDLICLMEDRENFYLYPNEHQIYMIGQSSLQPGQKEEFQRLLAEKAELEWIRPLSLVTANLKQIINFQRAVGKKRPRTGKST